MRTRSLQSIAAIFACIALVTCGGAGATDTGAPPVVGGDPNTPAPSVATTIVINRTELSFASVGESQTLGAEVRDQRGQVMSGAPVSWASSNPTIASVASNGVVTSVATGTATVTASSGSASATLAVTVAQTVTSIAVSPATVNLTGVGATQALTATVRDASGNAVSGVAVTWTISPTSVATISANGVVTSVASGQAVARATYQSLAGTAQVNVQGNTASCTTRPVFNEYLIDPSLLKVVTQIGVVGGGGTSIVGRSYAFAIDGDNVRLPLTAPTDLNVVAARHYVPSDAPAVGYVPDWSLVLDVGCGIRIEMAHVKDLVPSLKARIDTAIYSTSAWQPLAQSVPFRAGETFGWYMRGLNAVAFDVVAHDDARRNQFANQARYNTGSNLLDVVCPWTLFTPTKRDAYLAIIGAPTGQRVPTAGCGSVEVDVAGTPAGQWFISPIVAESWLLSKSGYYGNPLPLAVGVDSTIYVGHIGATNDIRIDRSNPTWKDLAHITTSWCYQLRNNSSDAGWLWLRMNTATQMDVAYEPAGSCPATFPATGFMAYYR